MLKGGLKAAQLKACPISHRLGLPPVNPVGNAVFGVMIEFFTAVVFKQPEVAAVRGRGQAAAT